MGQSKVWAPQVPHGWVSLTGPHLAVLAELAPSDHRLPPLHAAVTSGRFDDALVVLGRDGGPPSCAAAFTWAGGVRVVVAGNGYAVALAGGQAQQVRPTPSQGWADVLIAEVGEIQLRVATETTPSELEASSAPVDLAPRVAPASAVPSVPVAPAAPVPPVAPAAQVPPVAPAAQVPPVAPAAPVPPVAPAAPVPPVAPAAQVPPMAPVLPTAGSGSMDQRMAPAGGVIEPTLPPLDTPVTAPLRRVVEEQAPTSRPDLSKTEPELPVEQPGPGSGPTPSAYVHLATGEWVPLDRPVLLGRAPKPGADHTQAQPPHLVTVASPLRDVSRTHAEVFFDAGRILVRDLATTNGTTVARPGGAPIRLVPVQPHAVDPGTVISMGGEVSFSVEAGPLGHGGMVDQGPGGVTGQRSTHEPFDG